MRYTFLILLFIVVLSGCDKGFQKEIVQEGIYPSDIPVELRVLPEDAKSLFHRSLQREFEPIEVHTFNLKHVSNGYVLFTSGEHPNRRTNTVDYRHMYEIVIQTDMNVKQLGEHIQTSLSDSGFTVSPGAGYNEARDMYLMGTDDSRLTSLYTIHSTPTKLIAIHCGSVHDQTAEEGNTIWVAWWFQSIEVPDK
jgi:hypothetical protein